MHISDEVRAVLSERGFTFASDEPTRGTTYRRSIATNGAFGTSAQLVRIDPTGRWLERVDGWGTVERDCDLRDYAGCPGDAVDCVLA